MQTTITVSLVEILLSNISSRVLYFFIMFDIIILERAPIALQIAEQRSDIVANQMC